MSDKRYGMVIDLKSCIGCHACTVSCKMENQVPEGCFNTWVEEWDTGEYPNISRIKLPKLCNHCKDAPCVSVCPVEATFTVEGGIVVTDEEKCIGCGACIAACPYDARYMNQESKKVVKCTFCVHRVEAGLMPECVTTCPSHARYFGDLNDPNSDVSKMIKENSTKGLRSESGLDVAVLYTDLDKIDENEKLEERFLGGK